MSTCVGITCTGNPSAASVCFHTSTNLTIARPRISSLDFLSTGAICLQGMQLSDPKSTMAGTFASAMASMSTDLALRSQSSEEDPAIAASSLAGSASAPGSASPFTPQSPAITTRIATAATRIGRAFLWEAPPLTGLAGGVSLRLPLFCFLLTRTPFLYAVEQL